MAMQAGARFLATERGAFEPQDAEPPIELPTERGMLVARLRPTSLASVAEFLQITVSQLEARYQPYPGVLSDLGACRGNSPS